MILLTSRGIDAATEEARPANKTTSERSGADEVPARETPEPQEVVNEDDLPF